MLNSLIHSYTWYAPVLSLWQLAAVIEVTWSLCSIRKDHRFLKCGSLWIDFSGTKRCPLMFYQVAASYRLLRTWHLKPEPSCCCHSRVHCPPGILNLWCTHAFVTLSAVLEKYQLTLLYNLPDSGTFCLTVSQNHKPTSLLSSVE